MKRKYLKKVVSAALIGTEAEFYHLRFLLVHLYYLQYQDAEIQKKKVQTVRKQEKIAKHGKKRLQIRLRHIRNW